jgi:ubiquinol-cytochrome c reductase cytochrome b subunit
MGYSLPWSQMSGWGVNVITSLFGAFPLVGDGIVTWLWGGFSVDNPTLNRFFALHFLLPFVLAAVVFLHVWSLHITGSNNPLGIEPKTAKDTVPFNPYYTVKDMFGLGVFLLFFAFFIFFAPNYLTHADHYVPYNPMQTPLHIVPEWYFLPFYAILRSFTVDISIPFTDIILLPAKLQGVLAMFSSILILMILPWLDRSPVRSARFRPMFRPLLLLLVVAFVALGWAGGQPAEGLPLLVAQLSTAYYFMFFLLLVPFLHKFEKPLPLPKSIHDGVKQGL